MLIFKINLLLWYYLMFLKIKYIEFVIDFLNLKCKPTKDKWNCDGLIDFPVWYFRLLNYFVFFRIFLSFIVSSQKDELSLIMIYLLFEKKSVYTRVSCWPCVRTCAIPASTDDVLRYITDEQTSSRTIQYITVWNLFH